MKELEEILGKYPDAFIFYDEVLQEHFPADFIGMHPAVPLSSGEDAKSIGNVERICKTLVDQGADRDSLVIAAGGGTILDVVGFAASIYKRGIRHINIPTTLLAMVDAGIGGKTAANLSGLKNVIGTFSQPELTCIIPEFLSTLPEREFRSGSAEMLKTFIIADPKAYREAVEILSKPVPTLREIAPLIHKAASIKEKIVRKDPYDRGIRHTLNLGHTIAHAIEWWQRENGIGEPLKHGEAVAIGIIAAARKSEELGIAGPGLTQTLERDFKACLLPTELPCPIEELREAIAADKKKSGGMLEEPFISRPGKVIIRTIPAESL